jgi:hypothetical protein
MMPFQWFRRCALVLLFLLPVAAGAAAPVPLPKIGHVFVIVLENEGYEHTFGKHSPAPYLSKTLVGQGALLTQYFGIGHFSLDNYLAMISGQAPNPVTQADCQSFIEFTATGMGADGQALGSGCVYPASVPTLADQLQGAGLGWKGYMEDMGNDPKREAATCGHAPIGAPDPTQRAEIGDQYAARHNPFVYFHSIIDKPVCASNVVNLAALPGDLAAVATTPNYAFITPNLCNDGHDGGKPGKTCVDKTSPGGLVSADAFLAKWVPQILDSPAFKQDGLLIVTFDESDVDVVKPNDPKEKAELSADAAACCAEPMGPNIGPGAMVFGTADVGPGVVGPGGGRIGAVLVSRFIKPGTVSRIPYNHYGLLKSVEAIFGLPPLGYAGQSGLAGFGGDVFTRPEG